MISHSDMAAEKRNPVVFLDIDGVLNRLEDKSSYLVNNVNTYGISKAIMENLKKFLTITGADVVISSNWRKYPDNGTWKFRGTYFPSPITKVENELAGFNVSRLPYDPKKKKWHKVDYVSTWLEANNDVTNYVVFDDSELVYWWDNQDIGSRFVEVHAHLGLTKAEFDYGLDVLGFRNVRFEV